MSKSSMIRFALLWVSLAALHAQNVLTIGESGFRVKQGDRIVIDTNLRCRARPSLDSAASNGRTLGDPVIPATEVLVGNVKWYREKDSLCWIYGPATFLWNTTDPEPVAFAILDHLMKKDVRFEDFLEAETVMVDSFGWTMDGQNAHVSPRLRFTILRMLDTAVHFKDSFSPAFKNWEELHGDLLRRAPEPDQGAVDVSPEEYWSLFDANKKEPWADDAAWYASQWGPYADECGAGCFFGWVMQRQVQYWTRLPHGARIRAALETANENVWYRGRYACESDFDAISPEDVEAMKKSLSAVTHPAKQALLKTLDAIERKCRK